jgi:hypothetical protein
MTWINVAQLAHDIIGNGRTDHAIDVEHHRALGRRSARRKGKRSRG